MAQAQKPEVKKLIAQDILDREIPGLAKLEGEQFSLKVQELIGEIATLIDDFVKDYNSNKSGDGFSDGYKKQLLIHFHALVAGYNTLAGINTALTKTQPDHFNKTVASLKSSLLQVLKAKLDSICKGKDAASPINPDAYKTLYRTHAASFAQVGYKVVLQEGWYPGQRLGVSVPLKKIEKDSKAALQKGPLRALPSSAEKREHYIGVYVKLYQDIDAAKRKAKYANLARKKTEHGLDKNEEAEYEAIQRLMTAPADSSQQSMSHEQDAKIGKPDASQVSLQAQQDAAAPSAASAASDEQMQIAYGIMEEISRGWGAKGKSFIPSDDPQYALLPKAEKDEIGQYICDAMKAGINNAWSKPGDWKDFTKDALYTFMTEEQRAEVRKALFDSPFAPKVAAAAPASGSASAPSKASAGAAPAPQPSSIAVALVKNSAVAKAAPEAKLSAAENGIVQDIISKINAGWSDYSFTPDKDARYKGLSKLGKEHIGKHIADGMKSLISTWEEPSHWWDLEKQDLMFPFMTDEQQKDVRIVLFAAKVAAAAAP